MSVDQASLLRQTSQDLVIGNRAELGAFADIVCTKISRQAVAGKEPLFATKQAANRSIPKDALGTNPLDRNLKLSDFNYDFGRFHEKMLVDKAKLRDLEQYMEPLTEITSVLQGDIDTGIDTYLYNLLVNGTFNNTSAAATGVWSLSTSTPVLDIQTAKDDKVPGADTVIIGQKTARKLARHPDFKEAISNYAGSGSIGMSKIRMGIAEVLEMDPAKVFIFGKFYDAANPAQNLNFQYIAADLFWIGFQRGLILVEDDYSQALGEGTPRNAGLVTVKEDHNIWELGYSRVADIVRADKELGCYITGTV
jgi:hypothetical protein